MFAFLRTENTVDLLKKLKNSTNSIHIPPPREE